jgi:DnaJ-class molecular chaperone
MPDYYTILGVPDNATQRQIKAAYRKRMKEVHPDLAGWENVAEKKRREGLAKQINEAYKTLCEPSSRRMYDLRRRRPRRTSSSGTRSTTPTADVAEQLIRGLLRISLFGLELIFGKRSDKRPD